MLKVGGQVSLAGQICGGIEDDQFLSRAHNLATFESGAGPAAHHVCERTVPELISRGIFQIKVMFESSTYLTLHIKVQKPGRASGRCSTPLNVRIILNSNVATLAPVCASGRAEMIM